MIEVLNSEQTEAARCFAYAAIDKRSAMGSAVLEFISDRPRLLTSRQFYSVDEISWGIGEGRFVSELVNYTNGVLDNNSAICPMLWDNGYSISDIIESDKDLYISSLFPDLTQILPIKEGQADVISFANALRSCLSFAPVVVFFQFSNSIEESCVKGLQVSAIIMSAFDQEGALVWC